MLYSFDRFPEGPERSNLSLAMDSDTLKGPADLRVGLKGECRNDSLALEDPSRSCVESLLEGGLSAEPGL